MILLLVQIHSLTFIYILFYVWMFNKIDNEQVNEEEQSYISFISKIVLASSIIPVINIIVLGFFIHDIILQIISDYKYENAK